MGLYNNFPYTNFHEMNLDWLLNEMKQLVEAWDSYGTTVTAEAHDSADPEVTVTGDLKNGLNFDFGLVRGPRGYTGAQGPEGPEGPAGTGLEILDVYASLADLEADHPTGSPGDMYLVGSGGAFTLYVWSDSNNDWEDGGSLSAPSPSNTNPVMDGVASAGSSILYARGDHVHPSDTGKLSISNTDGVYAVESGVQTMLATSDNSMIDAIVRYDSVGDINTTNINVGSDISAGGDLAVTGDAAITGDLTADNITASGAITGDTISITSNDILNSLMLDAEISNLNGYRPLGRVGGIAPITCVYDSGTVPFIQFNGVDYNNAGTVTALTDQVKFTNSFIANTADYDETRIDLRPATNSRLGGVKIGSGVSVDANGVISVSGSGEDPFTSDGSVSVVSSDSTGSAPKTSTENLFYKMNAAGDEFMIFGMLYAKGSSATTACTITTSLQVSAPSSEIHIPGLPIAGNTMSTAPSGYNYLKIDTSGVVSIVFYGTVNFTSLFLPPIRIKLSEWE